VLKNQYTKDASPGKSSMKKKINKNIPQNTGLYDYANEHDSCGVGFVANINGKKTHKIVEQGIEVLNRLLHRGAVGGDENTGDGAGILIQLPHSFFGSETSGIDFEIPDKGDYGVGMVFLSREKKLIEKCAGIIEDKICSEGMVLLGWRNVPTDNKSLGKLAKSSQPEIRQFFIGKSDKEISAESFERKLYILRREIENEVLKMSLADEDFYIVSLSSETIVYKGLLMAPQVPLFYPDLISKEMKSALAVVHQRYSTNTFPTWSLAQPFRYLAHNGEINTLRGNINRMKARETEFKSDMFGKDIKKILPVIKENQSDSACLDNALELFTAAGRTMPHSMMMLIPQPWGKEFHLGHDLKGFFEYHAGMMEPWDGPAALVFSDGKSIGAMLDRNGLRPARYTITKDDFIVLASEAGVIDIPPERIKTKGCLRPGYMIFVDLEEKRIQFNHEIKNRVARKEPYRRWVDENKIALHGFFDSVEPPVINEKELIRQLKLFGYTREEINMVITPMAMSGREATGSMGNDAALAVLSEKPQLLYNYFKQLFAQVTNPPIDPIRERFVMSLMTFIGNRSNILEEKPKHAHLLKLQHPILTNEDTERLKSSPISSFRTKTIKICFEYNTDGYNVNKAVNEIAVQAEKAVIEGYSVIILSDRNLNSDLVPVPSLLAVSSVNQHLIRCGLRTSAGIVIETGEAREVMHFALLLGYGATAVNPYLALETVVFLVNSGYLKNSSTEAMENYIKSICKGLLKVMSKMGISTLRSYRGSQVFEAIGLDDKLVEDYFSGTSSRIGGIGLSDIAEEAYQRYKKAFSPEPGSSLLLETGGNYHYRKSGEKHLWTPDTITDFQRAVRTNDKKYFKKYASYINDQEKHLCTLRGLFKFKPAEQIPIEQVEGVSEILKRFVTGAMSFGSISKEAHEAIAIAMNRLGGMSNSGEGGEDAQRYKILPNNDSSCSAIKQVASGRFGVTAEYLASAKEIQIKIAQGAKPGEGGQLPGHKVDNVIAKVRHSTPGVTLISPPPHHDIYSIEDLAQLIYDLKNANPNARISVKLVSEVGVGTIAAGVAKGHADMILISGHDGGTGASPLTSIKYAGLPWELGLAETQQTLVLNNLRNRVRIQCDGQLKTGRDVIIAALLGAEEFGFATTILVCLGCIMMRKCHSNTCPVGVATQDSELRKRFTGKPEYIENFLIFIAEEVREYLAMLGFRKLDDIVGRSELLEMNEAVGFWKTKNLDFSKIFTKINREGLAVRCVTSQDHGLEKAFDKKLLKFVPKVITDKTAVAQNFFISNVDRTVGTMLSNAVIQKFANEGLPDNTINFTFKGCAGQSFAAFLVKGITFTLIGEANDYVGKGLSGGRVIIKPYSGVSFEPSEHIIAGNVLLYGATTGEMYINGQAGERFAIRNSGAYAVVEAVGDHCCEYMTGGRVVILGTTGGNFGAGMSGGIAYVYDEDNFFDRRCNLDMIDLESVVQPEDVRELKKMIMNHYKYTASTKAEAILNDWENKLPLFVKVFPMEYRKVLGKMMKEDEEIPRETIID
jgi:glutamate synthase domain-containing protein 2/glutamate synthase domain-containing protein 1/glutamate synthase domain-containing protein 3